jgi:hypothetical protein
MSPWWTAFACGLASAACAIGRALGVTDLDERFIGDIAEIVVFNVGLTDPERLQMEAYFKTHWQLP